MKMRIDYTTPNGLAVEEHNNNGTRYAIVRVSMGRFMVACHNAHHHGWTRVNRSQGGATHNLLDVLATDGLGGGPVLMSLTAARDSIPTAV